MDLCDLVFYHPPGAGYSRVFSERWNAQVFGDHADAQAAESFIRSFLDEHGTHRPFFLLGESFGSTRASLLSDRLSDLNLRGVVHVGPGYTGDVSIPRSVKDLIPLSATSWYYDERAGKPDLQTFLAPVRVFLYRDYLPALCQGTMLPPGERQRVAQQLEAFTGLPAAYYLAHDLHVSREDFRKERLKAKGLRIGSFDTRFTLPADETQDPTLARLDPWLDAAGRAHEQELGLQLRRSFRPNAFDESSAFLWPFDAEYDMEGLGGNWYPMGMTVSEAMHRAWEKKPSLRFFFATGLFDTVATVENTRFAVSHTRVPMENIELHEYESGHAVYADERSRHALARDLRAFLLSGLA